MSIYFYNCTLITPSQVIPHGALLTKRGYISAFGNQEVIPCPPEASLVDVHGCYLVPGFIDLQINGGFGLDFTQTPEAIWQVGAQLPRYGVTSFLPTLISCEPEKVSQAQEVIQKGIRDGYRGATALGLHLEGPFLNPSRRGAHSANYIRPPDMQLADTWCPRSGVRLVTLAPELPGALEIVRTLAQRGVVVGVGHSMASFTEAIAGIDAGIRYGTHLFNAMPAIDHRQPGLVSALLTDQRVVVGIIVDGVHVHPAVIKLIWEMKGGHYTNLVTDAMSGFGMPTGVYRLGDGEVSVSEVSARLADGRLAGSLLTLDQALRNLKDYTGCSLQEAVMTITSIPARLLGLENVYGELSIGRKANLVCLTHDLHVAATYIAGELVYSS